MTRFIAGLIDVYSVLRIQYGVGRPPARRGVLNIANIPNNIPLILIGFVRDVKLQKMSPVRDPVQKPGHLPVEVVPPAK